MHLSLKSTKAEEFAREDVLPSVRNLDDPDEFLVISTWQSSSDWKNWFKKKERREIQTKMDTLLGGETEFKIFHYGFTE